ncbi:hypothetical protein [Nocardia sp. XZ_19_369]|uniref:hypothetical protein n=1 Tax=Nocardia sp. XZ_19_369 TaxID=2769487 RepID=UPI001890472A|nr:hypothetical protein [Nocardia sp. XZ_19_369]
MTLGKDFADRGDWTWIVVGIMQLIIVVFFQLAEKRRREVELDEAGRLRVAMKDALQPLAGLIADMPGMNESERSAQLRCIAHQAVGALKLLLKDVDRLRAVVYAMAGDDGPMEVIGYCGRGDGRPPEPFVPGTPRGDLAIAMVRERETRFMRDIDQEAPENYGGSRKGYKTFIAAAIKNGEYGYGMVTVDAPRAGDLVDTDMQIVMLVADLLAIAFAVRTRIASSD